MCNEIEVCGQKRDGRTNERTNGDIEALADARRALENFCFIPMKISHKLFVRMDGTQFLL